MTPTALAKEVGLNQSTVQRFLVGDTKNVTPRMREMLVYAGIHADSGLREHLPAATEHPRIRKALDRIWDGREQTAEALAHLIEAIGPYICQPGAGPSALAGKGAK